MWSIRGIKKEGWNKLKQHLPGAILLTLVLFLVLVLTQLPNEISTFTRSRNLEMLTAIQQTETATLMDYKNVMGGMWSQIGWAFLSLLLFIFILSPVMVGYSRWFLSNSHESGTPHLPLLFYSFQSRIYWPILGGTFYKSFWLFIWRLIASLCFVPFSFSFINAILNTAKSAGNFIYANDPEKFIKNLDYFLMGNIYQFLLPLILYILGGIAFLIIMLNRCYAYSFVEWILADSPTIGAGNAMKRSKQLAYGIKGRMFLLDLSFIGWAILNALTLGLLSLGIVPYMSQTRCELYLKRKAESRFG